VSTTALAATTLEAYCWGADFLWDPAKAERFRQICRDALGRDCFCVEGEDCWLAQSALDEMSSLTEVGPAESVGSFEAMGAAREQQLLGYAWQLQAK